MYFILVEAGNLVVTFFLTIVVIAVAAIGTR
jgi:hypothetical protein